MAKVVQIVFSEKEYDKLEKQAAAEGSTVSKYIKNKIFKDSDYKKWFDELVKRVEALPVGTKFTAKMVLSTDWNNIKRGDKLSIGRAFNKYVVSGKIKGVYEGEKDSADVQWYEVKAE